jgi:hypothetical protein
MYYDSLGIVFRVRAKTGMQQISSDGITSGAGSAHSPQILEFNPRFDIKACLFVFFHLAIALSVLFHLRLSFFIWLLCFLSFDLRLLISRLLYPKTLLKLIQETFKDTEGLIKRRK